MKAFRSDALDALEAKVKLGSITRHSQGFHQLRYMLQIPPTSLTTSNFQSHQRARPAAKAENHPLGGGAKPISSYLHFPEFRVFGRPKTGSFQKGVLPQGLPHSRLKGKSQSWNGQNDDAFGHNYAFGAFVVAKRCRKGKIWEIPVRERSSCPKLRRLRQVAIGLQQGTSSTESLQLNTRPC